MKNNRTTIIILLIVCITVAFFNVGCHIGTKSCKGPGPTFCLWCGENLCIFEESDKEIYNGLLEAKYNKEYRLQVYEYEITPKDEIKIIIDCVSLTNVVYYGENQPKCGNNVLPGTSTCPGCGNAIRNNTNNNS